MRQNHELVIIKGENGYLIMVTWQQSQEEYIKRVDNISIRCQSIGYEKRGPSPQKWLLTIELKSIVD